LIKNVKKKGKIVSRVEIQATEKMEGGGEKFCDPLWKSKKGREGRPLFLGSENSCRKEKVGRNGHNVRISITKKKGSNLRKSFFFFAKIAGKREERKTAFAPRPINLKRGEGHSAFKTESAAFLRGGKRKGGSKGCLLLEKRVSVLQLGSGEGIGRVLTH